jgi:dihydrosphingosine 1-phosphate phosphatase
MINVLAAGVFWSGFLKDMLCLPRPLSPPLNRITMSGSAALEYGFPSTHSTNAVSVAVYAIHALHTANDQMSSSVKMALQALFYFYAVSIVLGRLYCGMHGFFDVIVGSALGALIGVIQIYAGPMFDLWISQGSWLKPLTAMLIVLVLVRIHPEPADDCPCFDDSVAFAGVVMGAQLGAWHYANLPYSIDDPIPGTVPYRLQSVGLLKTCIRIVLGVTTVFLWRGSMKATLLRILPPLFRFFERIRVNLPRRFFLNASQYTSIPALRKDDNVIPPASETLPRLFTTLRHPRKRAVSVGPQSAADAYETIAYRQQRRRESLSSDRGQSPNGFSTARPHFADGKLKQYEQMMGTGGTLPSPVSSPLTPSSPDSISVADGIVEPEKTVKGEEYNEEQEAREIFQKLERPRVRYDVEVVTKLIVYTGIAWLAVELNPLLFELLGLGMGLMNRK